MEALQKENEKLRAQLQKLQEKLKTSGLELDDPQLPSSPPSNPLDSPRTGDRLSSDDDEEDGVFMRIRPLFEERDDGSQGVEIIADVMDTPRLTNKKKKKKKRAGVHHARNRRRRPTVRALLQAEALLHSAGGDEQQQKVLDTKLKVLKELKRFGLKIEVVSDAESIQEQLDTELEKGEHSAFYLVNIGSVVEKYLQWVEHLPRVTPFYAVKSNPDISIVRTLYALGASFDCASKAELEEVLSIGASPSQIIFANPAKGPEHITFARNKGIDMMTFDSTSELKKIHKLHPTAKLVLRILADDSHSLMPFGTKFGASRSESSKLLDLAKQLDVNIIGVSFHVGSGCFSSIAWIDAMKMARSVFDEAAEKGFTMSLVDIGGGWPGTDDGALFFNDVAKEIAPVIDELFPPEVTVIAEPGRYFCTSSYTLAVTVNSRRERWVESKEIMEDGDRAPSKKEVLYYLSDGIYGSFNNIVFDHAKPMPLPLQMSGQKPTPEGEAITSSSCLFGPTCDSIDVICKDITLPELEIGDWLYFLNMGAYTVASATHFNGFKPPNAKYILAFPKKKADAAKADPVTKADEAKADAPELKK